MNEKKFTLNQRLFDAYLERMNFLNEISIDHPQAISFGSGRPDPRFFNVKQVMAGFEAFALRNSRDAGDEETIFNRLGQYNRTKGIINEAVARLLANDEQIEADPGNIIMTDGAQEGMAIVINSLFETPDDVLLVGDPAYIGFVGYAKIYGVSIVPVKRDEDSIDLEHLEAVIVELRREGKNPKVLYEVPDFHNPTGSYMPLEKRTSLIRLAEKYNFFIVEDNPYGYFIYETRKIPTLKALDDCRRVIHLGCFSKTIFPSIRMGYLVADQDIEDNGRRLKLAEAFKKTKSFLTVNTSALLQAMAGGFLHENGYSLKKACRPKVEVLKAKRDTMIESLSRHFPSSDDEGSGVTWTIPAGGFFLVLNIPFPMTESMLRDCVEKQGVIFCPMSFFSLQRGVGSHQIRLAFSALSEERIRQGIERLARYIYGKRGDADAV